MSWVILIQRKAVETPPSAHGDRECCFDIGLTCSSVSSKFVKERFASVKRALPASSSHGDVMKQLSVLWKDEKAAGTAVSSQQPHGAVIHELLAVVVDDGGFGGGDGTPPDSPLLGGIRRLTFEDDE